jgi:hypothetical protein
METGTGELDGCANNDPGLQAAASQSSAQAVQQLQQHQMLQQHMMQQQLMQFIQMHQHQKQQQFIQAHQLQQQQQQQEQQQQRRHMLQLQDQQAAQSQDALLQQALQRQCQELRQQFQSHQANSQQLSGTHNRLASQGSQQLTTRQGQRQAQHQQAPEQQLCARRQPTQTARAQELGQQTQGTPNPDVQRNTATGSTEFLPHSTSCGSLSQFSGNDAELLDEVMNKIFENSGDFGDGKSSPFSNFLGARSGAESSCGDGAESSCGDALRELASGSVGKADGDNFSDDLSYGSDSAAPNASDLHQDRSSPRSDNSPPSPLDSAYNSIYLGLSTNDLLDASPVTSRPPSD